MSDNPTKAEVAKSIEPDSSQINAEDAIGGPLTVTVDRVSRGSKEQPINVHLVGYDRVYRPCKTVRRILISLWSDDAAKWRGQSMTLYCDPDIMFGGLRVGGLRISHASGIDEPRTLMLTKSRGKRSEVVILPIKATANCVTLEDIRVLKVTWGKVYQDLIEGLDKEKPEDNAKIRKHFDDWLTQIIGEHDPKMLADADGYRLWTLEHLAQCKRAVSDDSKEDSHGNDST